MSEMETEGIKLNNGLLTRKCEYEKPELPCKLCEKRGFQCGRNEKVLGPKTHLKSMRGQFQRISTEYIFPLSNAFLNAQGEKLNEIDSRYLRRIFDHLLPAYSAEMSVLQVDLSNLSGNLNGNIYFPWFKFPLSSKSFRYATLALSYALDSTNGTGSSYLAGFYEHINEAIDGSSITEVVVSSYVALLCSFRTYEPIETLLVYFNGMRAAFSALKTEKSGSIVEIISYRNICSLMCASFRTLLAAYLVQTTR